MKRLAEANERSKKQSDYKSWAASWIAYRCSIRTLLLDVNQLNKVVDIQSLRKSLFTHLKNDPQF
jgi:hypothetical protein